MNYGGLNNLTQVSVNTDVKVKGCALTVAGATHIGPKNISELTNYDYDDSFAHYLLWVDKGVVSEDFVVVDSDNWSDFVFEKDYQLPKLKDVEEFIKANKHLSGIPSAKEVKEDGYSMHEMNKLFLQKIEELTLYTIEQEKKIKLLEKQLKLYAELSKKVEKLEQKLNK
ncbi:MAG: hypothetical protein JXQ93_02225 [Flavobacteriaceae bacterium]